MLPLLRPHCAALFTVVIVGLMYGLPNVFFMLSLGNEYRGIPMLQTPNEGSYLARIQEVVDGHEALGSPFLFEYKDEPPLSPPMGEWLYALPSIIFGMTPAATLVLSKFILPAVLFLLVYALLLRLTGDATAPQKLNAIACGLFVVLGYDLVDFRTVFSYLSGADSPGTFLLWARPVNPILGGIFLFSFLISIFALAQGTRRRNGAVLGASVSFALMLGTYFFSWGTALSILGVLILLLLFRREYRIVGNLALTIPLGALFAAPYLVNAFRAAESPLYESAVLRSGLFYTHYPLLNKFLIATLVVFVALLLWDYFLKRKTLGSTTPQIQHTNKPENVGMLLEKNVHQAYPAKWHIFCFALLLGGLWAYSQQMLTGRTIWPYHFVQYTIPLGMVVAFSVLFNIIKSWNRYVWGTLIAVIALSSLSFGVYTQVSAHAFAKPLFAMRQSYRPLFDFLNRSEKDCVVFVNETNPELSELNTLIPAFTHCNRYATTELYSLIPEERGTDGYRALLRLRGISADGIDAYLAAHEREAAGYLYSNWKGLFGVKDFPDFNDAELQARLQKLPALYREFLKKDIGGELRKYRLDYILVSGPEDERRVAELLPLEKVFASEGLALYAFPSNRDRF